MAMAAEIDAPARPPFSLPSKHGDLRPRTAR